MSDVSSLHNCRSVCLKVILECSGPSYFILNSVLNKVSILIINAGNSVYLNVGSSVKLSMEFLGSCEVRGITIFPTIIYIPNITITSWQ